MPVSYTDLIGAIAETGDNAYALTIPPDWMQGRTTYGGLTAALCLHAAEPLAEGRPLRSAQIAFIGPVGGPVSLRADVLRVGKNTAFIGADLLSESGDISARATFIFGHSRDTQKHLAHGLPAPAVPRPEDIVLKMPRGTGPAFIGNFDVLYAGGTLPMSGAEKGDNSLWLRHADRNVQDTAQSLLALGDAPPPAALSLYNTPVTISSMNWSIDVLTDTFETEDNWWLQRMTAQTLENGYSAQDMTLWNASGQPVMASRQTIAVFEKQA